MVNINDYIGKTAHFIGIGGSSMHGLAELLKSRGVIVKGSDRDESYMTKKLEGMGIPVVIGHYAQNVHGADVVIYTAAVSPDNVERMEAKRLGIPSMERCDLLGQLSNAYSKSVAVSGTHGKTTVTSMLAQIMMDANMDPNIHIGGMLDAIGGSVRTGKADLFVTEACEFNRSFLTLKPTVEIILNIDADHLDCYKDIDEIQDTFLEFTQKLPKDGLIIGCGDDERVMQVMKDSQRAFISYGFSENCDYTAVNAVIDDEACWSYDIIKNGEKITHVKLSVPGKHNVLNSLSAFICCTYMGADIDSVVSSMANFKFPHRRFELTGIKDGVKLYHDYGHNPSEYKTVVSIASQLKKQNRLYVVCQPHTYSRVKALLSDFGPSFEGADEVLVTDIYAARERDPGDINSLMLIDKMQGFGYKTVYCPGFTECDKYLRDNWKDGDIVLTVGCGNINLLNDILIKDK